jgi:aerobic carbon-monoxide dehydrogenase medium subunit
VKPGPLAYVRAESLDHALDQLEEHGDEARALAGGQSLVPMMNLRLATPGRLVDISRLGALSHVRRQGGVLRVGAATKQASVERSAIVGESWGLIPEALRHLAHPPIRNMGTIGGSMAHADPAAELPTVLAVLEARLVLRSAGGERVVPAAEFITGPFSTVLGPTELLTEIQVPPLPPRTGTGFVEVARREGDFGIGGAAALASFDEDGSCSEARLTLLAVGPTPISIPDVREALVGSDLSDRDLEPVAELVRREVSPTGDVHASAEFRRELAGVLAVRALAVARSRARDQADAGGP